MVIKIKHYKLQTFIITLFALIAITMCSGCKKSNTVDLTTKSIATTIKQDIVFKDELQNIDDKNILQKIYPDMNFDYITDFTVFTSSSGATAEEIAVFKLKNNTYMSSVKQSIENHINDQITNFENYVPEEIYKIKNSVMNINNNIILYVACDTPMDVETLLEKLYNK